MRTPTFILLGALVAALVFAGARLIGNDYVFFAGYTVLQFIVLATAWNILGGYTGYVNFGTAAFFALGAYSTVFFHKFYPLPIPALVVVGAAVSGLVGLGCAAHSSPSRRSRSPSCCRRWSSTGTMSAAPAAPM
jgi:branched-chain amino acid transport system permease protein